MHIDSNFQSKFYDQGSSGTEDGPMAFKNAIKSLPIAAAPLSSPNNNPACSPRLSLLRQPAFQDPSLPKGEDAVLTQLDDTVKSSSSKVQSFLSQVDTIVNKETTAAPPAGSADSTGSAAPVPSASTSPADDLAALQNGTATGNPPDDLTLPPGTTAADVAAMNGGLINNLNQLHVQGGTPAGDAAAQKYGYKDMKTLLADPSPAAAAAAGKILWAARACNNLKEADGADRPAKETSANTLSGIHKHGAYDGSTSSAFQNWLQKGTSIQSQTVFATGKTHADGEAMSNAQIIGAKIAGFFKKIFKAICPPLADLIQMAQDGAEKIRDKHVGDNDAASHDEAAIKKDGKNFGTDLAEFAATAALDVVAPEAEVGIQVAEEAVETGVKDGAKAASKAAESGGKDARSAARDVEPAGAMPDLSSLKDGLKNLIFGDDFKSKLTGLPKHATRQEKEEYVKEKVKDHLNDLLQQLAPPQNGNQKTAQKGDSASDQAELLAQLTQMLTALESPQPSGSGSGGDQWDSRGPASPVSRPASQKPVEATA
jgi:hypothetical protein